MSGDSSRNTDRVRAVWLFPATYVIHLMEEYAAGDGFCGWAERALGITISVREFLVWNAVALTLVCVGAVLVTSQARFRWIEIALSIAVLGNVAAHLIASVLTRTYSPGLISGVLMWVPVGILRLSAAFHLSSSRGRTAGVGLGVAVVLGTLAVLAWGAL
jgi:hypothetical protein